MRPIFLLLALLATAALYWTGLHGPYLLDDFSALSPIESWLGGQQSWQQTLLPNSTSIVFSRPVSMASFMLSSWIGGVGPFPLKLGNLIVHLLCGLLGWWLLRGVLRLDRRLAPHAATLATFATALWLLHPLHVSTVLYIVQRMAQLATLFTLAAVGLYLVARQQLQQGRLRPALLNLFLGFPLLLGLGLLSKQNAAIAGLLCLVLELAYFQRPQQPRVLQGFFGLFVALPALGVLALLVIAPQRLLGAYAEWDFTLWQRVLTQPRALFDYIGMWFVPRGPQMGLYTDGYPVSTDLLSPPTTLLAIVALAAISIFAIAMRKRAPSVFAGWFFFLVAHTVESSFLPLEMYYEHRNYLPSFGLLLMAFGLAALVSVTANSNAVNLRKLGTIGAIALVLVLGFATLGRVLVWQDAETIAAQGVRQHPESLRARLDLATWALMVKDYKGAVEATRPLLDSKNPRYRLVGRLHMVAIGCLDDTGSNPRDLQLAIADARRHLTIFEVQMARALVNHARASGCGNVTPAMIGSALVQIVDAATDQGEATATKYSIRTIAARLYVRSGRWKEAEPQMVLAWRASQYLPFAALLTRIYIHNGKYDEANNLLSELESRARPFDMDAQQEIVRLRSLLEQGNASRVQRP
jgi:protein O-mannosyl-transferase